MKTHVIQLDEYDDLTSVRDKMAWAKAPRILLIYPRRLRFVPRTLDLLLLKRHAASLGAQLALVSRSSELRARCVEAGTPVFETAGAAQRAEWSNPSAPRAPARRGPRPDLRAARRSLPRPAPFSRIPFAARFLLFTLAVLAALAVFLLFLPSASVELTPAVQTQRLDLHVRAAPGVTAVNVIGVVPAHAVSAEVDGSRASTATGQTVVADAFAAGVARFENLTESAVSIPVGTVVRTAGNPAVRFATQEQALLPAGVGKTVDVPVQALEAGPVGNLAANALTAIEGDLGASLSVANPKPTTGGTEKTVPIQTAADRAALREALLTDLLEACRAALASALASGDRLIPQSVVLAGPPSETYFPAEDQPGDALALTMRLTCTGNYVAEADLHLLAVLALDASLPDGFVPLDESAAFSMPAAFTTEDDGGVSWTMSAERLIRARLDPAQAALLILGLDPAAAAQRLQERLPLAEAPAVLLSPSWWPRLPVLPFRIYVSTSSP
jgi:hypothetical protein